MEDDPLQRIRLRLTPLFDSLSAWPERKQRIQQELLAHLAAAYEEEKQLNPDGAEDRALQRLGNPNILIQQLQLTVPRIEQLLLTKIPLPKKLNRWEKKFNNQVLLKNSANIAVLAFFLFFLLTCLNSGTISTAIIFLIVSRLDQFRRNAIKLFAGITLIVLLQFPHLLPTNSHLPLPLSSNDLVLGMIAGITFVIIKISLAKIITRMGNHSLEWKQLNLAE